MSESDNIPLQEWDNITLIQNSELSLEIDEKELLNDTACDPGRGSFHMTHVPLSFYITKGNPEPVVIMNRGYFQDTLRVRRGNPLRK